MSTIHLVSRRFSTTLDRNKAVQETTQKQPGSGAATGSLVCGIIGLIVFGLILGIVAIVMSMNAKKQGYKGGKATAGLVLGIIDIVGWAFGLIILASL